MITEKVASYLETLNAHHEAIVNRLVGAQPIVGARFAASCAEELMPLYELYAEGADADARTLRGALDAIWSDDVNDAEALLAACDRATPGDGDHGGTLLGSAASNAGLAAMVALKAVIAGDPTAAAPAGDRAIEIVEYVLDPDDDSSDLPPAVVAELERQLAALGAATKGERPPVVGQIADLARKASDS